MYWIMGNGGGSEQIGIKKPLSWWAERWMRRNGWVYFA
jgi:hypothetical protein